MTNKLALRRAQIAGILIGMLAHACGPASGPATTEEQTTAESAELSLSMVEPPGRSDQFVRGGDNMLWRRYSEGAFQHGWQYLGNNGVPLASDPAVASWGTGRIDVFAVNQNGTIDHGIGGSGEQFSWWDNWGTPAPGHELVGVDVGSGRWGLLDLFVTAAAPPPYDYRTIWHRRWDNGADTGWRQVTPGQYPFLSPGRPSVVSGSWAPDDLDVFFTVWNPFENRKEIWEAWSTDGGQSFSWWNMGVPPGADIAGDPDATSWGPGRVDLVVSDTWGSLKHLYTDDLWNYGWNTWTAPMISGRPAIAAMGSDRLRVFGRSAWDGSLFQCTWEGADLGCRSWGGYLSGGPEASSWSLPPCTSVGGPDTCAPFENPGLNVCNTFASCEQDSWLTTGQYPYAGDAPMNEDYDWTDDAQGIATDGQHWFLSQRWSITRAPMASLSRDLYQYPRAGMISGYDHYGDLDTYGDYIFVAVERQGRPGAIALFNKNLAYLGLVTLGTPSAPWVAVNPGDGLIYTSKFDIDANNKIRAYSWSYQNGVFSMQLVRQLTLTENGAPTSMTRVQGGAFSPAGKLYLASDAHTYSISCFPASGTRPHGIWGVQVSPSRAEIQAHLPFERSMGCYLGAYNADEVEGITVYDASPIAGQQGFGGQIHVQMIDIDGGDDDMYLKHFSVPDLDRL